MNTPKMTPTSTSNADAVVVNNQGKIVPHKTPTQVITESSADSTPEKSPVRDPDEVMEEFNKEAEDLQTQLSEKKDKDDSDDAAAV